jgi:MFS family permease
MTAMFASLSNPNYRRYAGGQAVSVIGTWMQSVAQSWLVLELTGSGTALGVTVALQTLPVMLLGPYAGVIADRADKRRLMMMLQAMMGVLALVLSLLTLTHTVALWQVNVLAFLLGLNNAFENPARQSFVLEMVGPGHLRNAVSLNSTMVNAGRTIGPAFAGVVIAVGGLGVCFLLNALSFVAVVSSLWRLDTSTLMPSVPARRAKGQLREGVAYVRRTPDLLVPLLMMAVIGCLSYEFQVTLPVLVSHTFHSGSQAYGFVTAAMGVGAVAGGLWTAARGRTGLRAVVIATTGFGLMIALAALAPTLWLAVCAMVLVGFASVGVMSIGNSTLQLNADPSMRGRVMALWAVAFMGSTPIGGPIAGWASGYLDGRGGLVLAVAGCVVATGFGWMMLRKVEASARRRGVEPARRRRDSAAGEPGPESVETVRTAEESLDQVGGVVAATAGEHGVAIGVRDAGVEQVGRVEGAEQVLRDDQAPHVGVVRRGVALEVAEAGVEVGAGHVPE